MDTNSIVSIALKKLEERGLVPVSELKADGSRTRLYNAGGQSSYQPASCFIGIHGFLARLYLWDWRKISDNKHEKIELYSENVNKKNRAKFQESDIYLDALARKHDQELKDLAAKEAVNFVYTQTKGHPTDENPYLKTKNIHAPLAEDELYVADNVYNPNDKKYYNDVLVVPFKNAEGILRTYGLIFPDGQKRFMAGGEKYANYYEIHARKGSTDNRTLICEGIATGITLSELTGARIICAGDCGSLKPVGLSLKANGKINPEYTTIASDYEWEKAAETGTSSGISHAEDAALAIGCKVNIPHVAEAYINGKAATDYNDLANINRDVALQSISAELDYYPESKSDEDEDKQIEPLAPEPPENIFPKPIEDAITDVANVFCEGHRGVPFAAAFSVIAHGINGYGAIEMKPDNPIGGNAFILVVGNSSTGKTEPFNFFFKYFDKEANDSVVKWRNELKTWRIKRKEIKNKGLSKAEERKELESLGGAPRKVATDLYDNMTDAALFEALETHQRNDTSCITIRGDEAKDLFSSLDAYKKNAVGETKSDLIKMWNGNRVFRKRTTTTSVEVPHAYLNISANTQPYAIKKMFALDDRESGFLGRFMFHRVNTVQPKWTRDVIKQSTNETIMKLTTDLKAFRFRNTKLFDDDSDGLNFNLTKDEKITKIFKVSEEGERYFGNWFNTMSDRLSIEKRDFLIHKTSINASKTILHIHFARNAFKLEDNFDCVSLESVKKGIEAMEYILECEKYIWDVIDGKKFKERAHPSSIRLAEIILKHKNEIDVNTRKVLNTTIRAWAAAEGLNMDKYQYRTVIKPLELNEAPGSKKQRGKMITEKDIARLIEFISASQN